jgi:hypothetical protein
MNLKEKILEGFQRATAHNSSVMVPPEVILWTDPEKQWESVIENLQESYQALFVLGTYQPDKLTGPAVWLKTIIAGELAEPLWNKKLTPVIYLPGISKSKLKEVASLGLDLQPLAEYQYTGTLFTQYNGKDWTVSSLLMNPDDGLGLNLKQDAATKEAVLKSLSRLLEMDKLTFTAPVIDAEFINGLAFPDIIPYILKWMCKGDAVFRPGDYKMRELFAELCKIRYHFEPDYKNIKEITLLLGKQENSWKQVWSFYAHSPSRYPEIEDLLKEAKPADLGTGIFKIPDESWPQVNEELENALRNELQKLAKKDLPEITSGLKKLQQAHHERLSWVWTELGHSPLIYALQHLLKLSESVNVSYPSGSLNELETFYTTTGFAVDTAMRKAYASVKTQKDKKVVTDLIRIIYKPWLETITDKFQKQVIQNYAEIKSTVPSNGEHTFYLFVDAFRFEAAKEFEEICRKRNLKTELSTAFSAFPTLTSSAKVKTSPVAGQVSLTSEIRDFTPQFKSGKLANIVGLREVLEKSGYCHSVKKGFEPGKKYWVEIGSIDTHGHDEQSEMLRRMDELFGEILEIISNAEESGIKSLKIVTDHGWLMLPGGLPAEKMIKDLTVARCGRCALIKEGVKTDFTLLPWEWNPATYVAYAPGIAFFKNNEEYAHGGISLQECVIPELTITIEQKEKINAMIKSHKWVNLRCNIETESAPDGFKIDIRTKFNDEGSSIVISGKPVVTANKCSLLVDDSALDSAAFLVLTDENGKIIDKINTTIGN